MMPGTFEIVFVISIILLLIKLYMLFITGRHTITGSLKGKVILITGGSAGIGKEAVRELARHGATVHILARNSSKTKAVIAEIQRETGNNDIHFHYIDLSNLSTVRTFAEEFLSTDIRIDVLINNAGMVSVNKTYTVDGNEDTFQANHLSHFLLTNLLLDRITRSGPSRIINVSSVAHTFTKYFPFKIDDLNMRNTSFVSFKAYSWSKLENLLFTKKLAERLRGKGVTVNALHPGGVRTEIFRNRRWYSPMGFGLLLAYPFMKNANEGAQTILYLATSPDVTHVSGYYFDNCRPASTSLEAIDDNLADLLWKQSEILSGLDKCHS